MRILSGLLLRPFLGPVAQEANRDYGHRKAAPNDSASWKSPARMANLRPSELVSQLEIRPRSTVMISAPHRHHAARPEPRRSEPMGRVIAETSSRISSPARASSPAEGLRSTTGSLCWGTETDPISRRHRRSRPGVDAITTSTSPKRMLTAIKRSLRAGGRAGIVDITKNAAPWEASPDLALTPIRARRRAMVGIEPRASASMEQRARARRQTSRCSRCGSPAYHFTACRLERPNLRIDEFRQISGSSGERRERAKNASE